MSITGHPAFLNATKDRPPAVQQTLKPILERIKNECSTAPEPALKANKDAAKQQPEDKEKPDPPQFKSSFKPKDDHEDTEVPKLIKKQQKKEDDDEF